MEDLNKSFSKHFIWRLSGIVLLTIVGLFCYYKLIADYAVFWVVIVGIFLMLKAAIEKLIHRNKIGYEFFITIGVILLLFEKEYETGIIILVITLVRSLKDFVLTKTIALIEDDYEYKSSLEYLTENTLTWLAPVAILITGILYIVTSDINLVLTLLIFISFPDVWIMSASVKMFARTRAIRDRILISDNEIFDEISEVDTIIFTQDVLYIDGTPRIELEHIFSTIQEKGRYGVSILVDDKRNFEDTSKLLENMDLAPITMQETVLTNNKLMIVGNENDYQSIHPYSHLKFLVGFSSSYYSDVSTSIISLDNHLLSLIRILNISALSEKIIKQNIFLIIPLYYILAVIAVRYFDLTIIQTIILFLVPEALVFLNSVRLLGIKIKD